MVFNFTILITRLDIHGLLKFFQVSPSFSLKNMLMICLLLMEKKYILNTGKTVNWLNTRPSPLVSIQPSAN